MAQIEINPGFDDFASLLALLHRSFAFMEGRIDPPSSLHKLDADGLRRKAIDETLITAMEDDQLVGCLFVQKKADVLYLGKLAVDEPARGQGVAKQLIDVANFIGKQWSCAALELETRVELTENQSFFTHLGFSKVGEGAHDGYTQATSYRYQRAISDVQS